MLAVNHLKNQKPNGIKKGCFFKEQLTGEESVYHILNFVNAQQSFASVSGEEKYVADLRKLNAKSDCLKE
jgi:hypothetical protein